MACPEEPPETGSVRYPIRGQVQACRFTCPACCYLISARELDRRQGVHVCPSCAAVFRIGIHVMLLPSGPSARQCISPDYTAAGKHKSLLYARLRSRKRRMKALLELGLADAMPEQLTSTWEPGTPANRVTVVRDPRESERKPE